MNYTICIKIGKQEIELEYDSKEACLEVLKNLGIVLKKFGPDDGWRRIMQACIETANIKP